MVKKVLISQPRPAIIEKSPFYELSTKHGVEMEYKPLIRVVGVSLKEFRAQRVEILDGLNDSQRRAASGRGSGADE